MTQIKYEQNRDELEIHFKEAEITYCKKVDGGITFEFDTDDSLTTIILPNFFKIIHQQPNPNANFTFEKSIFNEHIVTLTIKMDNRPINVKIDLTKLDK